jgi:tRNA1Val (adenine37-N6)-methyltransferase
VNVDALILAAFAAAGPGRKAAVDLGAGSARSGSSSRRRGAAMRLTSSNAKADLVELARKNLERAKRAAKSSASTSESDRFAATLRERADLVVSNPPFFTDGSARRQKHPQTARARTGSLEPFVVAAARALRGTRGRAAFAYPARSMTELLRGARKAGLVPKRLRLVHARPDDPRGSRSSSSVARVRAASWSSRRSSSGRRPRAERGAR